MATLTQTAPSVKTTERPAGYSTTVRKTGPREWVNKALPVIESIRQGGAFDQGYICDHGAAFLVKREYPASANQNRYTIVLCYPNGRVELDGMDDATEAERRFESSARALAMAGDEFQNV
ncbi:hypothetical protein V5E97_06895 [Singulisphaera sp. Ch08]|uniref:Uncharacterized protein n=1 Tax=Singulisphaera sp. Ch08 TaxID=3120278 RepID=A0AAU7CM65_9BACT